MKRSGFRGWRLTLEDRSKQLILYLLDLFPLLHKLSGAARSYNYLKREDWNILYASLSSLWGYHQSDLTCGSLCQAWKMLEQIRGFLSFWLILVCHKDQVKRRCRRWYSMMKLTNKTNTDYWSKLDQTDRRTLHHGQCQPTSIWMTTLKQPEAWITMRGNRIIHGTRLKLKSEVKPGCRFWLWPTNTILTIEACVSLCCAN